jgi:two-component system NarL family response regulator
MSGGGDSRKITVLVVDDHPIFRTGLRTLIEEQEDMLVVGEAANGNEALALYRRYRPSVTLMDLRMPDMDGPATIQAVLAIDPGARIIVLTTYDGDDDVERAAQAGAVGYLLKDTFVEGMLDAIRDVDAGELLFDEEVAAKLAGRDAAPSLSPRELTILELIARGLSNKEIQASLSIAEGTLRNHLKRIFEKFGVADRTQAALMGIKRGLIRMP